MSSPFWLLKRLAEFAAISGARAVGGPASTDGKAIGSTLGDGLTVMGWTSGDGVAMSISTDDAIDCLREACAGGEGGGGGGVGSESTGGGGGGETGRWRGLITVATS